MPNIRDAERMLEPRREMAFYSRVYIFEAKPLSAWLTVKLALFVSSIFLSSCNVLMFDLVLFSKLPPFKELDPKLLGYNVVDLIKPREWELPPLFHYEGNSATLSSRLRSEQSSLSSLELHSSLIGARYCCDNV